MSDGVTLLPGDVLRIERRFLVDGVVTTATTEGRFAGVERVGTSEHLVLEADEGQPGAYRLYPLSAISEITLVKAVARATTAPAETPKAPAWDPGVA